MKFSTTTFLYLIPALALLLFGSFAATSSLRLFGAPTFINVLNIPSLTIIIGGVLLHILVAYPTHEVWRALSKLSMLFSHNKMDKTEFEKEITNIIGWQREIRKNKLAAATSLSNDLGDRFEGYVFTLIATNYNMEELKTLAETRIASNYQKKIRESQLYATMGNASPAFGMFGTLLGLIVMLQNFQDTSQLGVGLGVALMTTLYGLMLAQLFFYPMEKKIKNAAGKEAQREQMILGGILYIMQDKPAMYIKDYLTASTE